MMGRFCDYMLAGWPGLTAPIWLAGWLLSYRIWRLGWLACCFIDFHRLSRLEIFVRAFFLKLVPAALCQATHPVFFAGADARRGLYQLVWAAAPTSLAYWPPYIASGCLITLTLHCDMCHIAANDVRMNEMVQGSCLKARDSRLMAHVQEKFGARARAWGTLEPQALSHEP